MGVALAATPISTTSASDGEAGLRAAQGGKPAFRLPDSSGVETALVARRGHPVLVHFFATWCEPCLTELPALKRLAERAGDSKLAVLAISVAEVPLRVRRFIAQTPVNFPILLDEDRAVAKSWDVSTLPTTFILDADLNARLMTEREFDWDRVDVATLLEHLTREKTP